MSQNVVIVFLLYAMRRLHYCCFVKSFVYLCKNIKFVAVMKKISFIALVMIILTACNHRTEYANAEFGEIKILKAIDLSEYSSLQLCRNMDCNYICVSLLDPDGQVDEFMGISNANFCTNDKGEILFDTVCFHPQEPSYILKAYDVSSTYGAETWFVLSPYYQGNPDSFWSLYRLPFDRLAARDVDGDGLTEIVSYSSSQPIDSTVYSFHKGVLKEN